MANLSKASNVVQEKYILYDVTGFTQIGHSIPVATNFKDKSSHFSPGVTFHAQASVKPQC